MPLKIAMNEIVRHIAECIDKLNDNEIEGMVKAINEADKIFVVGAGRSGMVASAFAMRLVQLGLTVYVIGESVTPAMTKDDLLIAVSGSGETKSIVNAAEIAKKEVGSKVLAVTSYPNSSLGKIADHVVVIKGRTKMDIEKDHLKHQIEGSHSTLTPLGTLFEDTVMVFFDGIVARLMIERKTGEADMKKRHATLE